MQKLISNHSSMKSYNRFKIESKTLTSPAKTCSPYGRNSSTLQSRKHRFGIFISFILEGNSIQIQLKAIRNVQAIHNR